jgi:serine O-acetyltransferase
MGVVVGEDRRVSADGLHVYQGLTLGGTSLYKGTKRQPSLGRRRWSAPAPRLLGGLVVGDGAKIGSNAVVIKRCPAGATAVGYPGADHPFQGRAQRRRHRQNPSIGLTASRGRRSLARRWKGLIDHRASSQDHQIALLWHAIEQLSAQRRDASCVPLDAKTKEEFEADKLTQLVGK